jgi:hypothetical protein
MPACLRFADSAPRLKLPTTAVARLPSRLSAERRCHYLVDQVQIAGARVDADWSTIIIMERWRRSRNATVRGIIPQMLADDG